VAEKQGELEPGLIDSGPFSSPISAMLKTASMTSGKDLRKRPQEKP
jgi:hypothetical protein